MKLERYTSLDNSIYELVKDEDFDSYTLKLLSPGIECGFMRGGCNEDYTEFINTYDETDYKTSDNILDLVEVGDLVESSKENRETYGDLMLVHKIYDNSFYNKLMEFGLLRSAITAIYKKQPNGDYKRYEVSSNEM